MPTEPGFPLELNVVSGGHIRCPGCGRRIRRFRRACLCGVTIGWVSLKIEPEQK